MEKFAVDLDKVLDELEFNEDRAENLPASGGRHHISSTSPSIPQDRGAVSHGLLESGDQVTKWRPKPVPLSQKTSVSGVFSSLNEYLNSGRAKPSTELSSSGADNNFGDSCSSQVGEESTQIPTWSPVSSRVVSTLDEKPDLIDSSVLQPSVSTSNVPEQTFDYTERQSSVGTLLPDIATTGTSANFPANEDAGFLDLLSHQSTNSSDVENVDTNVEDNNMACLNTAELSQRSVLSFGTLNVSNDLNEQELNDYLSDLELEEEELEYHDQSYCEAYPSHKVSIEEEGHNTLDIESQLESQLNSQTSLSKEPTEVSNETSSFDSCASAAISVNPVNDSVQNNIQTLLSETTSSLSVANSPLLPQFVCKDSSQETSVIPQVSSLTHEYSLQGVTVSKETGLVTESIPVKSEVLPIQEGVSHSSLLLSSVESQEGMATSSQTSSECTSQHTGVLIGQSSEDLSSEPTQELSEPQCISKELNGMIEEPVLNQNLAEVSDMKDMKIIQDKEITDACNVPVGSEVCPSLTSSLSSQSVDISAVESASSTSEKDSEAEFKENLTQNVSECNMEQKKNISLTLSLGENEAEPSNCSSPATPPTVPVTPTLEELPVPEEFTSTISTSSTPFMTPTAVFSESSEFQEEISEVVATCSPSAADSSQRPVRPSSLEIPVRTEPVQAEATGSSEDSPGALNATIGPPGATPCANKPSIAESLSEPQETDESATESSMDEAACGAVGGEEPSAAASPSPSPSSTEDLQLGKEPPFWVPDADAPCCMLCDFKFTVIKRRHHCRACGKVLCSKCCSEKAHLEYINAEARVCVACKAILVHGDGELPVSPQRSNPNPNNPMEYCSTVPPLLQAVGSSHQTAPTVMVPVGVLKREGSTKPKSEAKQVMFSDGIRPGADLAELDGSSGPRLSIRRTGRTSKRVGTPPGNNSSSQRTLPQVDAATLSYVPHGKGLPPVVIRGKDGVQFEEDPDPSLLMAVIQDDSAPPVKFTINRNLYVLVKILNLDCCVHRICWCFTSDGLSSVGQDEIVIILEVEPEESTVPKDIFTHLNTLYLEAAKGNTVTEMGHTLTQGSLFLGSKEHGGFLYVRPTFQCLHRLILPPAPYLVSVLIHKWETPWARVFPIRLMLRLGAEFRYYPCPLVSIRQRSAVYGEIGHTIIQMLADFRNMAYTLPTVRGLVIHMEDKQTTILLPRNRYDQVMRALNNCNDHVLAFGANFSQAADSHLVCMQSDTDHSYHTQAINIHNKPRKVTGASFVVFNGALKTSCGMAAKSSIVEDGLMVKVTAETLASLKTALHDMKDLSITCGPINPPGESSNAGAGASSSDEVVLMKWAEDDRSFNIGVLSCVDGRPLDGVPSIRVHNGTDYHGEYRFIRWTEVFILESEEGSGRTGDPVDISRLSERLAKETCLALVKLLDLLAAANLTTLAVRATIHPENVGYQAGSNGEKLPPIYMNSLDDKLVPVLHEAGLMSGESPAVLELVFRIMESG